ncbi:MAG TPA: carboxypeptidase regulatory-like domain-containing protein [Gemmatimonadales bacterium]|nr:carboxypeptidase regulatory-like domain-containing protein [Gemmatimonadales bacterium]
MTCGIRSFARLSVVLAGAAMSLFGSPAPLGAQSQATTGIIRGVVTDPNSAPVANAQVVLHETQTNFGRTLITDAAGNFTGTLLPLGTYDVTARAVGFAEAKRTGIPLGVGETVALQLQLAAVTLAPVTVVATQPVVEVTKAEASTPLAAQVVSGLPNNGRNYINLTLLTPNVAIVQGPDGDELSIGGQRGIHNNVSVDGADFNNPFFGEQRGGQRPAFTFNLDAVQELVVISQGANAEFGRSSGGFVNVITKSGTNDLRGSLHYYGKFDALSGSPTHTYSSGVVQTFNPDFRQHQFGFTLGGPLKRDKAFFFVAYDQQVYDEVKQRSRPTSPQLDSLKTFLGTAYGGILASDFGSIARTNDARAALVKLDWRLSERNNFSLKYNYTWSQQQNGTFDVDTWGASANGLEKDYSNAVNGSLQSFLSSNASNELRFQYSREDRPRPYDGPNNPVSKTPFKDTDIPFDPSFSQGIRIGMPFFLPIQDHDTRAQVLDNVAIARGNHLFKFGVEWDRTETVQTFIGFANGRMAFTSVTGFINYVRNGSGYVECSNGTSNTTGACPTGTTITGPVALYLQFAGVPPLTVDQAGTQSIVQNEYAAYLQDTWKPTPKWTLNYGLRWEAQLEPDPITPPSQVFFAPFIGKTVTNAQGSFTFPSDGTIPSDKKMFQPRLGFAYDMEGNGQGVLRGSAGIYYARIPGLNLASSRSTNGSVGQTLFRNSALIPVLGRPPAYDSLLASPASGPFDPDVYVFDRNFENPRTISASIGYERQISPDLAFSVSYTHERTDHLTRFINRNDAAFGSPWSTGLPPGGANGIGTLWTVESSAKSRYNGVTVGIKRVLDPHLQFQANYTLSFDKSDDDNERDPFTLRYANVDSLGREYNWSDRDQRHRFNGWLLANVSGFAINNRVSIYSAQPRSLKCGTNNLATDTTAATAAQRICPDGHILQRNTGRKDNAYFSWDLLISRELPVGRPGQRLLAILEVFNVTGTDNFKDPAAGTTYLNFDGTIRSGLGDPRQVQVGAKWEF